VKVRIKHRPSGLYNGRYWPKVGETMELPDSVAAGMIAAKQVEQVGVEREETRPDPATNVELTPPQTPNVETQTPADTGKVETATPPADTGKVEAATARRGRAQAAAKPAGDVKPDAGADAGDTPADKA
jgi:hypothetical protein